MTSIIHDDLYYWCDDLHKDLANDKLPNVPMKKVFEKQISGDQSTKVNRSHFREENSNPTNKKKPHFLEQQKIWKEDYVLPQ